MVSLVGAGPGDPDLLTLKAARRLREADLVLHDALVSPEIVAMASQARCLDVGKRAGEPSASQNVIHRILVQAARAGERVVRLKGGDPFVLGRGGEEMLALAVAGVPFEIVPGVSSAVAAPALSGIPVTHRGLSSAVLVVSGHAPEAYRPPLLSLAPHSATIVVLMGLASRAGVAACLIERGWEGTTPAATVCRASTPASSTSIETLERWRDSGASVPEGPGVLVVGDVVSLSERAEVPALFEILEQGVVA